MDENLTVVLTAVPLADHSEAQQWFQTLRDAYFDDEPDTWDAFATALAARTPATGESFCDYVGSTVPDPLDRIRELLEYGDTLPDWYFASVAEESVEGEAGAGEPAAGYDEADWNAFLTENGPLWAGTADTWQPWRDWFAYTAAERGLAEPATAFLTWLDAQPDKIAAFASYGVTITPPDTSVDVAEALAAMSADMVQVQAALAEATAEEAGDARAS